jgi:hypothetical protein
MKHKYVWLALLVVCLVAAFSIHRYAKPIPTSFEGAIAALKQIEEWAKWLTQVQLGALAVLLYIALDKDTLTTRAMTPLTQVSVAAGLISLSGSIFLSSWLLSSLPSQIVRIHSLPKSPPLSSAFDVYEVAAFGWLKWPTLGNLMSTVHTLWAFGLLCLGAAVLGLLVSRQRISAAGAR